MRVLIATVTAGASHVRAAAALEEAWKAMSPRDTVQRLDVLEFTPKRYRRMYVEGYVKLIEHAPELWAGVSKGTDNPTFERKLALPPLTSAWMRAQLARLLGFLAPFYRTCRRRK